MSNANLGDDVEQFIDVAPARLKARLESLPAAALDALPYGVIRFDRAGEVVFFSHTEAKQSGFGERGAIGRKFFTELAPCMAAPEFVRSVEQGRNAGSLDITIEHVGDFDDAERRLLVRMISASEGGVWVLLHRINAKS